MQYTESHSEYSAWSKKPLPQAARWFPLPFSNKSDALICTSFWNTSSPQLCFRLRRVSLYQIRISALSAVFCLFDYLDRIIQIWGFCRFVHKRWVFVRNRIFAGKIGEAFISLLLKNTRKSAACRFPVSPAKRKTTDLFLEVCVLFTRRRAPCCTASGQ